MSIQLKTNITVEDKYQSKNLKEQILDEPDTYIGSLEPQTELMWVLDNHGEDNEKQEKQENKSENEDADDNDTEDGAGHKDDHKDEADKPHKLLPQKKCPLRMTKREITFTPGLYKLFDEILVNAIDQWVRQNEEINEGKQGLRPVKNIKIWVDRKTGTISIYNDGDGIDVAMHKKEKMYVPQMIFAKLLTSGNYRNYDKGLNLTKITGGKNGYGSKLTCLFSNRFTIETVDYNRKKKYVQTFEKNLSITNEPVITSCSALPYTKITFQPDLEKFNLTELNSGLVSLMEKRAYDTAGYCEGVNVYYNDQKLNIKDFEKYTYLYLGNKSETKRVFLTVNDRWQVCVCASPNHELEQVSFVNGIWTIDGGKHVDHVADQIARKLARDLTKGKTKVDPSAVKSNLWIFVKSVIENPQFGSQAKEKLTTKVDKFGSKCVLTADQIVNIGKCKINTLAKNFSNFKESQKNLRTLGRKTGRIFLDKLIEGKHPGGRKSQECTLILTEGDSAKPFAVNGLKAMTPAEREFYGIFPLKGKLLNTRNCGIPQLNNNDEIMALIQILGLRKDTDYSNDINRLRYGHVLILTDQDPDGDHIKGLIMNFLHCLWPSLLARNDFVRTMITPLVMNWKEKKVGRKTLREPLNKFYSKKEYEDWKTKNNNGEGWLQRYYKGLGTSEEEDAVACFQENKIIQYIDDESHETHKSIQLAFDSTMADARKLWLYNDSILEADLDYNIEVETYPDFINKRLKLFSLEDCTRSIPNLCDGLKPSQRKIIYTVLRRNIKNPIKVDQLVGKITAETAYHHGETSLAGAIVNLAQNYIGSHNNINLLYPAGNFGTRLKNGKDSSATRYIYTKMESILPKIFHKSDLPLYRYAEDDDIVVEPIFFSPIIPTVLINGSDGIGTGFSTHIPSYNPADLLFRIKKMLAGERSFTNDLVPWYRGFKGTIKKSTKKAKSYICEGRYAIAHNSIKILELPVGSTTCLAFDQYKIFLESLEKPIEKVISDRNKKKSKGEKAWKPNPRFLFLHKLVKTIAVDASACTAEIFFVPDGLNKFLAKGIDYIKKDLKLITSISTNNLTAFNENSELKKYNSAQDLLDNFFDVRLGFYKKRLDWTIEDHKTEINKLDAKYRFVCEIMDETIVIKRKKKVEIVEIINQAGYPKFYKKVIGQSAEVGAEAEADDEADDQGTLGGGEKGFNYLLNMKIYSFSAEMLVKLKKLRQNKQEMLDHLKTVTGEQLWSTDLADFEKHYQGFMEDWYDAKKIKSPPGKIKIGIKLTSK